jgi:hypothetical protein
MVNDDGFSCFRILRDALLTVDLLTYSKNISQSVTPCVLRM